MGAAPSCRRTRGAFAAAAAVVAFCGLAFNAAAVTKPSSVWGVELPTHKNLAVADLVRLHKRGLNALVVDPSRFGSRERGQLAAAARRAGMVVAFPQPAKTRTAAQCASARRGPARTCALLVRSPRAAVKLARRNVADYAVLRLDSVAQLRFLQGVKSKTHILAVAHPAVRKLNRSAWTRAVKIAAADPVLDLAVVVDSSTQPTLETYLGLVKSAQGASKKTIAAYPHPTTRPRLPARSPSPA